MASPISTRCTRANNDEVQLYAFILAVNGDDLRSLPLSMRKALIWNGCWRAGRLAFLSAHGTR
jgi:ATP-dependent DNA ligase